MGQKKNSLKTEKKMPVPGIQAPLSLTLCADQNTESAYSFCSQINPEAGGSARTPVPATVGPDPRNANACLNLSLLPSTDAGNGVRLDFNHGFRVKMPQGEKSYALHVWDADTQTLIANMTVPGGSMAVGDRKYFIRYHLEVIEKETGRLIAVHDYDCEGKRVMIVIPDGGLGDNLAWMPYAEEFRKKYHAKVTCVCGDWLTRIIRDQYPELDFASVANIPNSQDFYASYFCAIFPPERKAWRPSDHQNFGMQGSIARILGVDPVPCKVRFPHYPERPVKEPYVCISALATNPAKYWNYPDGWNILCRYLKRLGYRVFVIDRDHDLVFNKTVYSVPAEAEDCTGLKPITERMAMLQHAEFFIGLPSGLSWLAWNCNIPVVMISGFTMDGSEFPTPYRVFNQNFCHGCWNDSNLFFDAHVPVWCPRHVGTAREIECTRAITPKMVIDAVSRIPSVCTRLRPPVTFALPVHDPHPELLPDMLAAVIERAKEYGNAEVLICDDASAVPAVKIFIEEYRRKYPELVFAEYAPKEAGFSASLRKLLGRAQGRYFIPVEQNALLLPFDLYRIIGKMEKHPEIICNYAKKWQSGGNGPEGIPQGAPFSSFQSLYSPMQVQAGAVFRTGTLRQCGAWDARHDWSGCALFRAIALLGICEYTAEVRTLALRQNSGAAAVSMEKIRKTVQHILAPYKETVSQLKQGRLPEMPENFPLAAIAGAVFFLQQKDKGLAVKLLTAAREHFSEDPGVRMLYLQFLAGQKDPAAFKTEWDSIIHAFPDAETHYAILAPSIVHAVRGGLFSMKQRNALKNMSEHRKKVPGAVIDAWNNILSPAKGVFSAPVDSVRISVIIPVFRGNYITDCVHSVVAAFASYGQTEILLYNDASQEPDLDVRLQMLKAENPDMIRVFRGKTNLGVALARQEMLKHVKGDYIVSFDHDDIMLPFNVKRVVDFMDANPQYCASYAPKYLFNRNGYMNEIHGSEFSYFQCFFAPKVNINAAFLRKNDLLEAGGFMQVHGDKESPADDIYLYTRMFQKKDVWFDHEARVLYRMHDTQITHGYHDWDTWITQQPYDQHPELVKRILAGDIPDPCGPDFRLVRGLMGAVMFFHQFEHDITEPIIQAAVKYFPEDPGVPVARLILYKAENRMDELSAYYPKALEQFKDTVYPRLAILNCVLSAMQAAQMPLPPELVKMHTELHREYYKLTPAAERMLAALKAKRN